MVFLLIGATVGMVMGITGAGGAIIAIPLFQSLVGATLKEASVLSLLAVILGTLVNLSGNFKDVQWKIAGGFAAFGTVANYLSIHLKKQIPEYVIVILLLAIGLFSIRSVWKSEVNQEKTQVQVKVFKIFVFGCLLGVITTLTGLGGGVLLIPILLNVFHMNYEDALPTSLGTITLISFSALLFQGQTTLELIRFSDIAFLGGGAVISFFILKAMLKHLNESKKLLLRKIVFSMATVASLTLIIIKAL